VFPAIGLVVSGGHTNLYDCHGPTDFEWLGATIDDAAGEAFDKVAQILGLSFPGGPAIEQTARGGNIKAFKFPRVFLKEDRLEFSFSGLKTAVLYKATGIPGSREPVPELTPQRVADLAASFQDAVVDVLVGKCRQALRLKSRKRLLVGGGVAANGRFRERLQVMCRSHKVELFIAPHEMCTDNAAMAAIAWELFERGQFAPLDVDVTPGLVRKPKPARS
jgi:N6-L-threonylcarbamoyladenine synthase